MTIAPPRPTAAARRDARSAASGRSGGSWRVSLRLAMRQVRRSWATSLLVVVLILLPISGATGVLVFAESNRLSTAMTIDTEIGSADAALEIVGGPDPTRTQYLDDPFWTRVDQGDDGWPIHAEQEPPESAEGFVPDGAQVMSITGGMVDVETEHGRAQVDAEEGAAWDPLVRGRYLILDGRAPTNDSEAMVTPAMLERLGAEIGDTLTVIDPPPSSPSLEHLHCGCLEMSPRFSPRMVRSTSRRTRTRRPGFLNAGLWTGGTRRRRTSPS
ncbi:hypothetical protein ACFOEP_12810 [Microbacterium amylolyticum]|uniref:hypothetical protein n=1 Tax=Microbacterium amylolyticum TaxID=936337 RepID=UPI00361671A7